MCPSHVGAPSCLLQLLIPPKLPSFQLFQFLPVSRVLDHSVIQHRRVAQPCSLYHSQQPNKYSSNIASRNFYIIRKYFTLSCSVLPGSFGFYRDGINYGPFCTRGLSYADRASLQSFKVSFTCALTLTKYAFYLGGSVENTTQTSYPLYDTTAS